MPFTAEDKKILRNNVHRGIVWMAKHEIDWLADVDEKTLRIRDIDACIIGQAIGWDRMIDMLDADSATEEITAVDLGFDVPRSMRSEQESYSYLQEYWIAQMRVEREYSAE